jgi:hypothetical protein
MKLFCMLLAIFSAGHSSTTFAAETLPFNHVFRIIYKEGDRGPTCTQYWKTPVPSTDEIELVADDTHGWFRKVIPEAVVDGRPRAGAILDLLIEKDTNTGLLSARFHILQLIDDRAEVKFRKIYKVANWRDIPSERFAVELEDGADCYSKVEFNPKCGAAPSAEKVPDCLRHDYPETYPEYP